MELLKKLILFIGVLLFTGCTPEMRSGFIKHLSKRPLHVLVIGDSQSFGGFDNNFNQVSIKDSSLVVWDRFNKKYVSKAEGYGFYPELANTIKEQAYYTTYLINFAKGNSYYRQWAKDGYLYEPMLTEAKEYLRVNEIEQFDLIYVRVGGLDGLSGEPLDSIQKHAESLYHHLQLDFKSVPILLGKSPGSDDFSPQMKGVRDIEQKILDENRNIFELYDMQITKEERSIYTYDGKHLHQWYMNEVGAKDGAIISELIKAESIGY